MGIGRTTTTISFAMIYCNKFILLCLRSPFELLRPRKWLGKNQQRFIFTNDHHIIYILAYENIQYILMVLMTAQPFEYSRYFSIGFWFQNQKIAFFCEITSIFHSKLILRSNNLWEIDDESNMFDVVEHKKKKETNGTTPA